MARLKYLVTTIAGTLLLIAVAGCAAPMYH